VTRPAASGGATTLGQKTLPHGASVSDYLDALPDAGRREDAKSVAEMLARITGEAPKLWGPSMIGYGAYAYTYDSGHSGLAFRIGFAPRKSELVLYIIPGCERFPDLMAKLGRHRVGKSCLYVKRLADISSAVLEALLRAAWDEMTARYPR
jgi:hypothetical protein